MEMMLFPFQMLV